MAEAGRIKSTRRTRRRSAVQGRNQDNQTRRLIAPSPTFGHSSRAGARQLLGQAIEAEVAAHIEAHADLTDASGRRRIVRHGHMPEREVQTGIGAVTVKRPRVRDRDPQATGGRIRFTSSILPPYLRRAKSVEAPSALALSEGHLQRRLFGGPGGAAGTGTRRA